MTDWLWRTDKEEAWVVGYAWDPVTAKRILDECWKDAPETITYHARIQVIGIRSREVQRR